MSVNDELIKVLSHEKFLQFMKDCSIPNRPIDSITVKRENGEIKEIWFDGWIFPVSVLG